jgi:hypothetical protein
MLPTARARSLTGRYCAASSCPLRSGHSAKPRQKGGTSLRSNSAQSRRAAMTDDPKPPLRLVSDRTKGEDFESFDRSHSAPRYRQRRLEPWQPKRKRPKRPDAPGQRKH